MKVAIVHYWTVIGAGGDQVLESLLRIYPEAEIFMLLHDPAVTARLFPGRKIHTSFLQRLPGIKGYYTKLLALMPAALESLDLTGYDLIISSEAGPAKGIIPPVGSVHVCYCHSPMRYIWDQFHTYKAKSGFMTRAVMTMIGPSLRAWDESTCSRVDAFVANSNYIAGRISRFYGRTSEVIYPPVHVEEYAISPNAGDFYLAAGRHVSYKRLDLAIAAANQLGRRLIVTGCGTETAALKRMAGPTVEFVGHVDRPTLRGLYSTCRALLMPAEEDFGIVPVEVMASGRPVIAYGRGGALDTVIPGRTGLLFAEQSVESLTAAILQFEEEEHVFDPHTTAAAADRFSERNFRTQFSSFVDSVVQGARRS